MSSRACLLRACLVRGETRWPTRNVFDQIAEQRDRVLGILFREEIPLTVARAERALESAHEVERSATRE